MAPSAIPGASLRGLKTAELTAHAVTHKIETGATLQPLDASKLKITKTTTPMPVPELNDPIIDTGSHCTDHMVSVVWKSTTGWEAPELHPYRNLSVAPTASVLHYATECFEGMKMFRGYDGKLRLFRPNANCERMLISAMRIALPAFDPKELEKLITALAAVDGPKWLPVSRAGSCVYLRSAMIGTAAALGLAVPKEATLFIVATFMPILAKPRGLRLMASQDGVRAWPGGFGYAKVGANYGPSLKANGEAVSQGYDQVLWLLNGMVTEAGASNFFIVWRSKEGKVQLVTAPLGDKIILDGVTRRSILQLARERLTTDESGLEPVEIVERNFTMTDIVEAVEECRIIEAFAVGTAYFVCPVSVINYRDQDLAIPMARGNSGEYAAMIKNWLVNIMYGKEKHEWGVVVQEGL